MKKGRDLCGIATFSLLKQTSGRIATVWSRWKKGALRTVLRTAMDRLGPIQKFGPPDGIVTAKFDSLCCSPEGQFMFVGELSHRLS